MIRDTTAEPDAGLPLPPPPLAAGARRAVIGWSARERPISCLQYGRADARSTCLGLAGQHGDERPARRTLQALLTLPSDEIEDRLPNLRLAVVPEANPDGCAVRSRCNADGIDLNRDHQLLQSPEAAAIHRFARSWLPDVILDLHSYPSRRRHLLEHNVVLNHDVFLDVVSHPAILARQTVADADEVLRCLLREIVMHRVRADRYTIVKASGRARHSTADVVDARNGLALRCGAFAILIENRQLRREETAPDRLRLRAAQERALWTVIEWLDGHHDWFKSPDRVEPPAQGTTVPVRFKYRSNGRRLRLICRDAQEGRPIRVTFSRYAAALEPRRLVPLPAAYAVPREAKALTSVLQRHGFVSVDCRPHDLCSVERLRIERARPSRRPGRPPRKIVLRACRTKLELDRYEVYPVRQTGGDALAVYLEPESKHGLHRFPAMQIPLVAPAWYPVLRVLEGPALRHFLPAPTFAHHQDLRDSS